MSINEAISKSLPELKNEFTGYQLTNQLKKYGIEHVVKGVGYYLNGRNDIKKLSRATYRKMNMIPNLFKHENTYEISDAIKLLKNNGYKVLKPITEFKEL